MKVHTCEALTTVLSESLKILHVRIILSIILSMWMGTTETGCHSRVNTCSIQKYSLFYSSRVTAADRAGQEGSISYSQWNICGFWKHSTAPFSCHPTTGRRQLQNWDKLQTADCSCWMAKSPKVTDQLGSLQKDQNFESLSSFLLCIYLDQIIFLLGFHDSICCYIVNSCEDLCTTGNQWVGKLRHYCSPELYWFLFV